MAYEMKPDTLTLFRNKNKQTDTDRDYSGQALVAGVHYWASGYINESKSGKYLKVTLKPKDERPAPRETESYDRCDDDDLLPPF